MPGPLRPIGYVTPGYMEQDFWNDDDLEGPVLIRRGKPYRRIPGKEDKGRKSLIRPKKVYRRTQDKGDYVYFEPEAAFKYPRSDMKGESKSAKLLNRLKQIQNS